MASPIEHAYGLLWQYQGTNSGIHRARRLLLSVLDKDGQSRGITAAQLDVLVGPEPPERSVR